MKKIGLNQEERFIMRGVIFILTFTLLFNYHNGQAQQYNVAGSAVPMTQNGCYRLTNTTSQSGAVWNVNMINLNNAFDITLKLNFGNRPGTIGYIPATCGADGMTFVLQPLGSGVFGPGGGVGFQGITPSLGIVMDTYTDNPTDPSYQHISIHKNGDVLHNTTNQLVSYTAAVGFPTTITDGLDHLFRFVWLPMGGGNGLIMIYFGNATTLPTSPTITYTGNVITSIFGGNPNVYWGVSGSTGGCWNTQYVCMTTISNFNSVVDTCVGAPVQFTSTSISGLPISWYKWTFGDGDTSNIQNPSHIYANPGTYAVTLMITNTGGFTNSYSQNITIHPNPVVIASDTSVCDGDTAQIYASGANTYLWNTGATSPNINVFVHSDTNFIVTGKNSFGCKASDTSQITLYPNPSITISSDTFMCDVDTISLVVSGGNSYVWSTTETTPVIDIFPTTSTTYFVTVTDTNNCWSDSSVFVTVYHKPIIELNNDTIICNSQPVDIIITGGNTYEWDNGSTDSIFTLNPIMTTTYFVTATGTGGCKTTDDLKIEVIDYPIPSLIKDVDTVCKGKSVTLTASGADSYLWSTLSIDATISIKPAENSTYTVTFTNEYNGVECSDTLSIDVFVRSCNHFYVPNSFTPDDDGFNDCFGPGGVFDYVEKYEFYIFDRWGKIVFYSNDPLKMWDGKTKDNKPAMIGAYTYLIYIKEYMEDEIRLYGTATLIR